MSEGSLPSGTLTFLLTDIEGSTRLWQDHPEVMGSVIERHDALIAGVVGGHGGVLVASRGEGDSTFSVFTRPTDAVAAAVDVQRGLTQTDWPSGIGIRVRTALHTGEAELRDGTYYGTTVNRCARLRSITHGGQTVCSQTTAELVADRLPDGVAVHGLGTHRLRDIDEPERVFQVSGAEAPDDFPPLRSLDASPGALPTHLTQLVGRRSAIEEVAALLARGRLVTLTGSGGCGKTRLAIEVAREVGRGFSDGARFVDLGPLESGALVANAVAASLQVSEGGAPLTEILCRTLAGREMLLVLDNCEHVADEVASLVHELLTRCPAVVVLATSREPLRVDAEATWRVPSLTIPSADAGDPLAALLGSESGRLFCDRARLSRPEQEIGPDEAPAATSICRQLDGIPLAIELAAARLRSLDVATIADSLADRFRILDSGPRTAPPRQQTLEASVGWTYDLLEDDERRLFGRLSVFAGPFTTTDARAVCGDEHLAETDVVPLLAQLADRSLVQGADEATGRHRMLETIRHYARARLADSGEERVVRDRHLRRLLELGERFEAAAGGVELDAGLELIQSVIDDVRAAIRWSLRSEQVAKGMRLAASLRMFWLLRNRAREGRDWLVTLLDADDGSEVSARIDGLLASAHVSAYALEVFSARDHASEAADLSRQAGDGRRESRGRLLDGWVGTFIDPPGARQGAAEGVMGLRANGDDAFMGFAQAALGMSVALEGDLAGAVPVLAESLEHSRTRGDPLGLRLSLGVLGYVETYLGRLDEAEARLHEAAEVSVGDTFHHGLARSWLGLALTYRGSYEAAMSHQRAVLEDARTTGDLPPLAWALLHLGLVELALGRAGDAVEHLTESLPMCQILGRAALALRLIGDAAFAGGDATTAVQRWRESLAAGEATSRGPDRTDGALAAARAAWQEGNTDHARTLLRTSLRHGIGSGYSVVAVEALETAGLLEATSGEEDDAARILAAAEAERERMGYVRFPVHRPSFEEATTDLEQRLGGRFEALWSEGRGLSLAEAVALASRESRPPRPPTGWEALTPAEVRVARLVGEGLTNPQIGERLFISPRTVQSHLRHVFEKLGIATRAELAAEMARLDREPTA